MLGHTGVDVLKSRRQLHWHQLYDLAAAPDSCGTGAEGAFQRNVRHVAGEMPASQLFVVRLGELLIHGWDIARSTGGDEHMDAELTEVVSEAWQPLLAVDQSNRFGDGPVEQSPTTRPCGCACSILLAADLDGWAASVVEASGLVGRGRDARFAPSGNAQ